MRIEILRSVMISGEPAYAGSFVEVAAADGQLLIGMGKARLAPNPEPEPEAPHRKSRKATTITTDEADA